MPRSWTVSLTGLLWSLSSASSAGNGAIFRDTARRRPYAEGAAQRPTGRAGGPARPSALLNRARYPVSAPAAVVGAI